MKAIYVQPGNTIDYKNETDAPIPSGTVIALQGRVGILTGGVTGAILPGETGALQVTGVFRLPTAETFAQGAPVFWDGAAATATDGSNTPAGWAVACATGTVDVKIGG